MNVQNAINAGLVLEFVYTNWQATGASGLNGLPVTLTQPCTPPATYKVARTIYSCDLATDIHPQAPGKDGWKVIGMLAFNEADQNDVIIAIRGTENIWEYIQDFKFFPKPFSNVPGAGLTDDGFTDMYQSFSFRDGDNGTPDFIQQLISYIPPTATVTITGHSLGGPLATLLSLDLAAHAQLSLVLYTFASPRTGDLTFHNIFNHTVPNCYRIVNRHDIVPQLPPPLLYFHVGDENEMVPGQSLKWGIHCEHHLSTYLNLLGTSMGAPATYPLDSDCMGVVATQAIARPIGGQPALVETPVPVEV